MTTTTEKPSSSFVVFRQHLKGFTVGALAACGAVTFTNPWEVRMYLIVAWSPYIPCANSVTIKAANGSILLAWVISTNLALLIYLFFIYIPYWVHAFSLSLFLSLSFFSLLPSVTAFKVVKTRLQLQGELQAHQASGSQRNPKQYPNAFSAMGRIFKTEGIAGIQKGLAPAYIYQILLNGTRLGLYDPLKLVIQSGVDRVASNITGDPNPTNPVAPAFAMVTSGAMSGVLGALIASPLFLIKTRMQSYTKGSALAVGHQHSYVTQGTFHSLVKVFHSGGIRGLWRGVDASMMRTGVGSSVQLSSYDGCKQALLQSGWFDSSNGAEGGIGLHFVASLATSLLVCIAMNPFDVASTRMYNQHESADGKSGSLYKNGVDCLIKTVRSEGARALYKGFFANYLRVGPHTILTFVFLEQLRAAANRIELYFS